MLEIERKFLVKADFKQFAHKSYRIAQAYLSSVPERTVRVRIKEEKAFLTIKGKGNESGTTRFEWEKEIDINEAEQLLKICESGLIDKTRYIIEVGEHSFEVDEFHGENRGLVLAEIELQSEDESYEKPSWLGEEVTGDKRFYNSYLVKHPFIKWESVD
jgi:adenylate cyclase